MARARTDRTSALAFDAITVEGALIAPAMLARIAQHEAGGQSEADYGIPKGLTLRDEIARYFRIGQALFSELTASETPSTAATIEFRREAAARRVRLRRHSPRSALARSATASSQSRSKALGGRVPVVVVPPADDLDRPSAHLDHRRAPALGRLGAAGLAQCERATRSGACARNGVRLRLVRDNASLTRPAYIEADLRRIFEDEAFADFAALWLLDPCQPLRASRHAAIRLRARALARGRPEGGRRRARQACATASRRRCSASATGFCRIPTMARCASGCGPASCRCPSSSASFCASSIA